jgi:phosphopantetheinyl transferase
MILFFAKGETESDRFIKYCYKQYCCIMSQYGADLPKKIEIVREEGKKPRFDTDKAHFSLSHSHGVIMAGISHTPIGVDVEKIRPTDFKSISFIKADSVEEFFEKWTERESYVKYTGEGLSGIKKDVPPDAHFEHFPVFEQYHACVCAEEQSVIAYQLDLSVIAEES